MNEASVCQLKLPEDCAAGEDAPVTLRITCDLSYENAHQVVDRVSELLLSERKSVVLELDEVGMVDSSGLRALLQTRKLCEDAGVDFRLGSVSGNVSRIISMSGFARAFGLLRTETKSQKPRVGSPADIEPTEWKVYEHVAASEAALISFLRDKVSEAALEAGLKSVDLCDVQIAVGEALTNAYRHGSPQKGANKIQLRCMTCPNAMVIEIEDEGAPFDPNAITEPDPNEMREHGMGIYLMRQAMDVVEFQGGCPGNRVRMIKWLNT